jgi:raffinose/stachyose/melibiose transport system substrate-binding protein
MGQKIGVLRMVALGATLTLVAAACARGTTSPTTSEETSTTQGGAPRTVSIWLEDFDEYSCFIDVVDRTFQHETIELDMKRQPSQWDSVRTALAGGGGPDIVLTPGPSFAAEVAKAGALVPLDRYVESLGLDDFFVEWALDLGVVDGKIMSLPSELETMVIFYNKTLFEENGWEPPSTVDGLMTLAGTIADAGITPFAGGNAEWRAANEWYISAFLSAVAGPEAVYSALIGEKSFADPEFVRAIEALDQLQQNGWISGGLTNYYTTTFDEFYTALANGDAAMNIEGSWQLGNLPSYFTDNEWDWMPFPSSSGEVVFSIGVGLTFSINANSEVPDQAAEVLAHIFDPETQATLVAECGATPAPVRMDQSMLAGLDERVARLFASTSDASDAGNYGYLTWTFWPPQSQVYTYEEIEKVWSGQISAADYLAGLATLFTEELEAGAVPPVPER